MDNYDSIFAPKKQDNAKSYAPFDKEAWAQRKQAERQSAYALMDETAERMATDGDTFRACLDVMARFDRYSVGNILLITGQLPEATKLADFDTWKQARCFIKKGENGIMLLEPGEEFRREDGSMGVNYNVKRLFDISQTTSRQQTVPTVSYDMRLLLKALSRHAPCTLEISEQVPDGVGAVYDPAAKKILMRQGMDGADIFRSLTQELAHAYFDKGNYNRNDHAFAGYCVAYEFDKLLATMRSREISVSIIIQNMAQLKALFEKQWESIVGNCDTFLYLGGNEQSSHKYVSELLGKETIDTNTYGSSYGRNGNYSKNYQLAGRELMTPDEVRMLDNRYALLFIRGEFPVRDLKYDILKHPNVRFTTDGQGKPYIHGEDTRSIATLTLTPELLAQAPEFEVEDHNYVLICEEELQEIFERQGGKQS